MTRFVSSLCVLCLFSFAAPSADFFVSPTGDDQNPGSLRQPFATLSRARAAVRELGTPQRNVVVFLRGGRYVLKETVVFSRADSAAPGYTVQYAAYPGEKPVFTSARPVGDWRQLSDPPSCLPAISRGKVWVCDVSALLTEKAQRHDPSHGVGEVLDPLDRNRFYSLYLGDARLPRARGKGFDATKRTPRRHRPDSNRLFFPSGAVRNWPDLTEAELRIIPCSFWIQNILPFEQVDEGGNWAKTLHPGTYSLGKNSMTHRRSCFVENTLAVLDEPGEWVLHPASGKLYYWPRAGRPEPGICAPMLTEFIRVEGEIDYAGAKDTPVNGIVFKGIRFEQGDRLSWHGNTGWGLQHDWEMFDRPSALVRLRGAENCAILDCEFRNSAHTAIRLDLHAQRNRIEGNHIHDVGGVGILLAGYGPGTKDVNRENRICNNYLHHTGWMFWASPAVFVWQSGHNDISHNHLHHTPYTAVVISGRISWSKDGWGECSRTVRWNELEAVLGKGVRRPNWKGREPFLHARYNRLTNNEMHNVMQRTGDGNAIYVSGCGTDNLVARNWCHDNFGLYMNAVIRNDDDQHGSIFDGNLIARSGGHGEGFINKGANTIVNNVVVDLRPDHRHRSYLVLVRYDQSGAIHRGNVYYAQRPNLTAIQETKPNKRSPKGALLKDVDSDGNLYFSTVDAEWGKKVLEKFQPQGVEKNSRAADPLFVDPGADNFQFRENSPALALGIPQPVKVGECGLQPAYRQRWYGSRMRCRIEPAFGKLKTGQKIAISCTNPRATIRYTLDDSEPTENSPRYVEPLELKTSFVLRARAFAPGQVDLTGACARFTPPPQPVSEDFEKIAVGEMASVWHTSEEGAFTARVSDEQAASGKRSLKFIDGPGQKYPFNPHVFFRPKLTEGKVNGRFAMRLSASSEFYYQWRTYADGKFFRGPTLRALPGGRLTLDDEELMTVPTDAWIQIGVSAKLDKTACKTFDLRVVLPDGSGKVFTELPCAPGFFRLDWVGFVSVATETCTTFIDDIEIRPDKTP